MRPPGPEPVTLEISIPSSAARRRAAGVDGAPERDTGIGIAVVGNALGLKSVIVIPDTQSQEKKDALRLLGAQLIEVPAVPYKNPNNYVKVSERLAKQLAKDDPRAAIWANQFDNVANRQAHQETTGAESVSEHKMV